MGRARSVLIVVSCLLAAAVYPAVAQTQQLAGYTDGYEAGRIDAKEEIKPGSAFVGGLILGVFYVGYSALTDGQMPPVGRIKSLNATDDYKRGYLEGYQKEWKSIRTKNALFGWGTWVTVVVAVYYIVLSSY
jgi:hypothetical protein